MKKVKHKIAMFGNKVKEREDSRRLHQHLPASLTPSCPPDPAFYSAHKLGVDSSKPSPWESEVSSTYPSSPYSPLFMFLSFHESCRVKGIAGNFTGTHLFYANLGALLTEWCCFQPHSICETTHGVLSSLLENRQPWWERGLCTAVLQPLLPSFFKVSQVNGT